MYSTTDVVTTLHHGTAFEIDRTRAVCVALLLALCMAGCSKTQNEHQAGDAINANRGQHQADTGTARCCTQHTHLLTRVTNITENYLHTFNLLTNTSPGVFPPKDVLWALSRTKAGTEAFKSLLHDGIHTTLGEDALHDIVDVLTNMPRATLAPGEVNEYLMMAGEALERSGSKAQAVPFYEAVIERAEQGHSTIEASNAAFFLGLMYVAWGDDKRGMSYYEKFAEFSRAFDHNGENAVFAEMHIASLKEANESLHIYKRLIAENPDTIHMPHLLRKAFMAEERLKDPGRPIHELFLEAQKRYPAPRRNLNNSQ